MSGHLPECNYLKNTERNVCICERLRACEERVRNKAYEEINEALKSSQAVSDRGMFPDGTGSEDASERAYHRGLRDACILVLAAQ